MHRGDPSLEEQAEESSAPITQLLSPKKFAHPLSWILYKFLMLYIQDRDAKHEQVVEQAKYYVQNVLSYVTRTEPVIDKLKEISNHIITEIENAKDFDGFYKLIGKFREFAQEAQAQKSYLSRVFPKAADTYSLLHDICYALASLTICYVALKDFSNPFNAKVNTLLQERLKLKESSQRFMDTRQGRGVKENDITIANIILELAHLGLNPWLKKAIAMKLLPDSEAILPDAKEIDEYKCKDAALENLPLRLQSKFFLWAYKQKLQKVSQISFNQFFNDAILEYRGVHQPQQLVERSNLSEQDKIITLNSQFISIKPDEFVKDLPALKEAASGGAATPTVPAASGGAPAPTTTASGQPKPSEGVGTGTIAAALLGQPTAQQGALKPRMAGEGPTDGAALAEELERKRKIEQFKLLKAQEARKLEEQRLLAAAQQRAAESQESQASDDEQEPSAKSVERATSSPERLFRAPGELAESSDDEAEDKEDLIAQRRASLSAPQLQ